jgi:hypothetical protein
MKQKAVIDNLLTVIPLTLEPTTAFPSTSST